LQVRDEHTIFLKERVTPLGKKWLIGRSSHWFQPDNGRNRSPFACLRQGNAKA
jgi:hypothetical protein